jgi:hypothetical protein
MKSEMRYRYLPVAASARLKREGTRQEYESTLANTFKIV